MTDVIKFGVKEFKVSDVFSSPAPTCSQMASFCSTLKMLVESGVNILDALAVMTKSVEHPWLLAILYFAHEKLREGETITSSIAFGFQDLISLRIEEIKARKSRPEDWRTFEPGEWAIPDFFGECADLLSMIDVGEETGSLHIALGYVRDINLGKGGYGEKTWGKDIAMLNRALAVMFDAGIPLHGIARILLGLPSLNSLRDELKIVSEVINDCDYLSKAFAKTKGRLADPRYLGLIEAGERAGAVWAVFDEMHIE